MECVEDLPGGERGFIEHLRSAGGERLLNHIGHIRVGEDDDRHVGKLTLRANLFQDVGAVHFRQHQIEQHAVRMEFMDAIETGLAVFAGLDRIAFLFEAIPVDMGHNRVVLDNEYVFHNVNGF
jgi:hypothetical protein